MNTCQVVRRIWTEREPFDHEGRVLPVCRMPTAKPAAASSPTFRCFSAARPTSLWTLPAAAPIFSPCGENRALPLPSALAMSRPALPPPAATRQEMQVQPVGPPHPGRYRGQGLGARGADSGSRIRQRHRRAESPPASPRAPSPKGRGGCCVSPLRATSTTNAFGCPLPPPAVRRAAQPAWLALRNRSPIRCWRTTTSAAPRSSFAGSTRWPTPPNMAANSSRWSARRVAQRNRHACTR